MDGFSNQMWETSSMMPVELWIGKIIRDQSKNANKNKHANNPK